MEDGAPYAWGGPATSLLQAAKRASGAGDKLPPYASDDVQAVRAEMAMQVEHAQDLRENPHVDMSTPDAQFYPSHTLLCEAALRNKRILHAYARLRQHALTDAYWQVGQNIPTHTLANLHSSEALYYRGYSSLCSAYMDKCDINLRANLRRPPHVTDMTFVKGLKDFTYMSPETGQSLLVRKGKLFMVTQEEADALVQQGSVEAVAATG